MHDDMKSITETTKNYRKMKRQKDEYDSINERRTSNFARATVINDNTLQLCFFSLSFSLIDSAAMLVLFSFFSFLANPPNRNQS